MKFSKLYFLLFFLSQHLISFGQKNSYCRLDTFKIVTNQNIDNFIYKLEFDSIYESNNKSDIPNFIKESLDCLTTGDFSLCNSFENFRSSCTSSSNLPRRQLKYLGKSKNLFAMIYLTGGIIIETHILLIIFNDNQILDLWAGNDIYGVVRNRKQLINFLKKSRTKKYNSFGYL